MGLWKIFKGRDRDVDWEGRPSHPGHLDLSSLHHAHAAGTQPLVLGLFQVGGPCCQLILACTVLSTWLKQPLWPWFFFLDDASSFLASQDYNILHCLGYEVVSRSWRQTAKRVTQHKSRFFPISDKTFVPVLLEQKTAIAIVQVSPQGFPVACYIILVRRTKHV